MTSLWQSLNQSYNTRFVSKARVDEELHEQIEERRSIMHNIKESDEELGIGDHNHNHVQKKNEEEKIKPKH